MKQSNEIEAFEDRTLDQINQDLWNAIRELPNTEFTSRITAYEAIARIGKIAENLKKALTSLNNLRYID